MHLPSPWPPARGHRRRRLTPIAVTLGDPAGIGPDITLLAGATARPTPSIRFAVYGDADVLRDRARALGLERARRRHRPAREAGRSSSRRRCRSCRAGRDGQARGRDRARPGPTRHRRRHRGGARPRSAARRWRSSPTPSPRSRCSAVPLDYPGHTAFLGQLAARHTGGGAIRPVMMLAAPELRVVPATVHIPLAAVPRTLTRALIVETGAHRRPRARARISASPARALPSPASTRTRARTG